MKGVLTGRRLLATTVLGFALLVSGSVARAQESEAKGEAKTEEKGEPDLKWHLINTGIFFLIAGYGIWKLAPSFFNARSDDIQRAIKEATGLKMEADFRSSEIDRKMATLPQAVEKMRVEARAEMERENERRKAETAQELRNIDANLASDVEGMRAEGAVQIRRRATKAALWLAERRLKEAGGGDLNEAVADFVNLVDRGQRA